MIEKTDLGNIDDGLTTSAAGSMEQLIDELAEAYGFPPRGTPGTHEWRVTDGMRRPWDEPKQYTWYPGMPAAVLWAYLQHVVPTLDMSQQLNQDRAQEALFMVITHGMSRDPDNPMDQVDMVRITSSAVLVGYSIGETLKAWLLSVLQAEDQKDAPEGYGVAEGNGLMVESNVLDLTNPGVAFIVEHMDELLLPEPLLPPPGEPGEDIEALLSFQQRVGVIADRLNPILIQANQLMKEPS